MNRIVEISIILESYQSRKMIKGYMKISWYFGNAVWMDLSLVYCVTLKYVNYFHDT